MRRKVVPVVLAVVGAFLLDGAGAEDLDLAAEDHLEGLTADGLVDAGKAGAVTPLVELAAEGIGLELEEAELAGSKSTNAPAACS